MGVWDWLAGLSYGMLALSYVMRDMRWLRVIAILAASLDLAIYYNIRPDQPMWVQFGFSMVFVAINMYQLYVLWLDAQGSRFEGDAKVLYESVFKTLTPGEFRRVLALGQFVSVANGVEVLRMGHAVDNVTIMVAGELAIFRQANILSHVSPGAFIGEMGYITGKPASVNVRASKPSRVFSIACASLLELDETSPDLHSKLMGLMGRDIAEKLHRTTVMADQKDQELSEFRASQFMNA